MFATELSRQQVMNFSYASDINTLDNTDMHQLPILEYLNEFQFDQNDISSDTDSHSINTIDYYQSEQLSHVDHEEIVRR